MGNTPYDESRAGWGRPAEDFAREYFKKRYGAENVFDNDPECIGRPDLRVLTDEGMKYFEVERKQDAHWHFVFRGIHTPNRKRKTLTSLTEDPDNTFILMIKEDGSEYLLIKGADALESNVITKPCRQPGGGPKVSEDYMETPYKKSTHMVLEGSDFVQQN